MKKDPAAPEKDAPEDEQDTPETSASENTAAAPAPQMASDHAGTDTDDPPGRSAEGSVIKTRRKRMIVYTVFAALAGLLAAWCFAVPLPNYLLYATPLEQSDAVVLFAGGDYEARRKMADELVAKGWGKFVIQPATGEILEARVSKAPVTPEKTARMVRAVRRDTAAIYVEETHVEVVQALDLLEHIDAKQAIFVGSPYQMRRIAIIVDHLFPPGKYEIAYQPTIYEPRHVPWFLAWQDVKWVFSEWVKIVWFILYSPFV